MVTIICDAIHRFMMRRDIAKLRVIFVRAKDSKSVAACDALRVMVDAGEA